MSSSRLLTAAEVAERLGYTERYVWRLGREGVLPRVKVPGRKYVRFAEEDVERFIARGRSAPAVRLPGFVGVSAETPRPRPAIRRDVPAATPRPRPRPRY